MPQRDKEPSIFVPFSPESLVLGLLAEVGVRAAGEALNIPDGAAVVFTVAANATIETAKNAIVQVRAVLNEPLDSDKTADFIPAKVRNEVTTEQVKAALKLLNSNETRIDAEIAEKTRLAYQQAMKNRFGLKAGVSLVHLA